MRYVELLKNPNPLNALDSTIAHLFNSNREEYNKKAKESVVANANKPVEELMKDIFGEEFETK